MGVFRRRYAVSIGPNGRVEAIRAVTVRLTSLASLTSRLCRPVLPLVRTGCGFGLDCAMIAAEAARRKRGEVDGMSRSSETAEYLDTFRVRGAAISDACTGCGDCFRACPMTG